MLGIDVEHNDPRYLPGDHGQIGCGPTPIPPSQLLLARHLMLEALPAYNWLFRALAGRHDGPTTSQIAKSGFKVCAVMLHVLTFGLPRYAKQATDQQFARWVMVHVLSNPLPICTRTRVLLKGKRT